MSSLKNIFKDFLYFHKEIAYLVALSHVVFIFIIIILSIIVREQKQSIRFLQNGINRQESIKSVYKPRVEGLLESEYRMLFENSHR